MGEWVLESGPAQTNQRSLKPGFPKTKRLPEGSLFSSILNLAIQNIHCDFEAKTHIGKLGFVPGHGRLHWLLIKLMIEVYALTGVRQ